MPSVGGGGGGGDETFERFVIAASSPSTRVRA
jgi:hypothetical protein